MCCQALPTCCFPEDIPPIPLHHFNLAPVLTQHKWQREGSTSGLLPLSGWRAAGPSTAGTGNSPGCMKATGFMVKHVCGGCIILMTSDFPWLRICFSRLTVFIFLLRLLCHPLDFLALTLAMAAFKGAPRGKTGIRVRLWPQGSPIVSLALCALAD